MEISKRFGIEAAHWLPQAPDGHKCRRLHGHSFAVTIYVRGPVEAESGWVMDFAEISAAFKPLHDLLDHRLLNDVVGLENPTSEHLAIWCWRQLEAPLPDLYCVEVAETCTSSCRFYGASDS